MERRVGIVETTVRDGQQSLWATRMTTPMMLPILPVMDGAGFEAIECFSTAVMDSCVRWLKENPWERLRLVKGRVIRTPLQMMSVCMGFSVGIGATPDDFMELFFRTCAAGGIDRFFFEDGLNDLRNFEVPIRAARSAGSKVLGGVVYSISPVHTDDYFVARAEELVAMGVDILVLKDPNGILTPERVRTLVPRMRAAAGGKQLYCHSHCVTGLGPAANLEAIQCGADAIWTAASPLANGASMPATESMLRHLTRMGFETGVDGEAAERIAAHFRHVAERHGKPLGKPAEYDPSIYQHQLPGGMISNFRAQLAQLGIEHRLEEVLAAIPEVRADLGWSLMVTPFSQVIGTQAALNVLYGKYEVILDEVRKLVLGYYGRTPAPVHPDLLDRAANGKQPITDRPGAVMPPALERLRAEHGASLSDEDLLLRYLFMPEQIRAMQQAGSIEVEPAIGASSSPLVDLVREVARRKGIKRFHLVM